MTNWRSKDVLTVDEVASILSVDRRVVYASIHNTKLNAVKLGSRILRVPVSSLKRFLGEQSNSADDQHAYGNVMSHERAHESD